MAAALEIPCAILLRVDSDSISVHPLPDNDCKVAAALIGYGAAFDKKKRVKRPPTNAEGCLDLLTGILWLHLHLNDLAESWPILLVVQQRLLAVALSERRCRPPPG